MQILPTKISMTAAAAIIAVLAIQSPSVALQSPTTGQRGAPAIGCGTPPATNTPGGSTTAQGSAFNPDGTSGGVYAGNGSGSTQHAGSTAAVSQYDVACLEVTSH